MTTPANIENVVPPELSIPPNQSAAKAILMDKWFELPPQNQDAFTYESNDTIEFRIGSNMQYVDFSTSFIRFDLAIDITGLAAQDDSCGRFELDGGLHALFRDVYLRTTNGDVELEEIRDYGHNVNRKKKTYGDLLKYGSDMVESGDGLSIDSTLNFSNSDYRPVVSVDYTDGEISIVTPNIPFPVTVGDIFQTELTGGVHVIVTNVLQDNTFLVTRLDEVSLVADTGVEWQVTKRNRMSMSRIIGLPTVRASDGTLVRTYRVIFQPDLELWKGMFPLLYVNGGLRLQLVLQHPLRAFINTLPNFIDVMSTLTYSITNPRLHCRFITTHPSIRNTLRAQFDTEGGLEMAIMGVTVRKVSRTPTQTTDSIEVFPGLRSIRGVQIVFQDTLMSEGSSPITLNNPSLSMALSSSLTELYLQIGSLRFPDRRIEDDYLGSETMFYHKFYRKRMMPHTEAHTASVVEVEDWLPLHQFPTGTGTFATDSLSRIFSFDTSRAAAPFGYLTGIDATSLPIILNVKRTNTVLGTHMDRGFTGNVIVRWFIDHDKLITFSASAGIQTSQ